jgi:hypothetical protein
MQCQGDLAAQRRRFLRGRTLVFEPGGQSVTVDEIADDVDCVAELPHLVHAHNTWVLQLRGRPRLAEKLVNILGLQLAVPRYFDRHDAIQLLIVGLPHGAECPLAQLGQEVHVSDLAPSNRCRRRQTVTRFLGRSPGFVRRRWLGRLGRRR